MGFYFFSTCSKCDYYLQNQAWNMKAQTRPRSELSKMWQCTARHKVGDLYSSQSANTPYRPTNVTMLNSYICSDRSSSRSSSSSKNKRERLFQACSPDVEENNNNNVEPTTLSQQTVDMQLLIAEHDRAVA